MRHKKPLTLLLCLLFVLALFMSTPPSSAQRNVDIEKRVSALLARMTLEEKLGQLQQLDGQGDGNFRPEHVDMVRKGLLGSTLGYRSDGSGFFMTPADGEGNNLRVFVLPGAVRHIRYL